MRWDRRKRNNPEFDIQCGVVKWAKLNEGNIPELALLRFGFEGTYLNISDWPDYRQILFKQKLIEGGLKMGFPDIHWPISRGQYAGAWVEVKSKDGSLTPDQKRIIKMLIDENHLVRLGRSVETIIKFLEDYYDLSSPPLSPKGLLIPSWKTP